MRNAILTMVMLIVAVAVLFTAVVAMTHPADRPTEPKLSVQPAAAPTPAPMPMPQARPEPRPQPAPAPPPQPARQPNVIERVPLDGQDLADLMNLSMWKYRFRLPESQYTAYVWVEYWTRSAKAPDRRELFTGSGTWSKGDIVVKLPTERDASMLIRVGDSAVRAQSADAVRVPAASRLELLDSKPLELGEDLHLATFTFNEMGIADGGLANVHHNHDLTLYLKARFVEGPYVPFDETTPAKSPMTTSLP